MASLGLATGGHIYLPCQSRHLREMPTQSLKRNQWQQVDIWVDAQWMDGFMNGGKKGKEGRKGGRKDR